MYSNWVITLLLSALVLFPEASLAQSLTNSYVPGEIIIKYKDSNTNPASRVLSAQAQSRVQKLHVQMAAEKKLSLKRSWSLHGTYHYKINSNKRVSELLAELKNDPRVEFAEPNYYVVASATYTQTSAPIDIPQAWGDLPGSGTAPLVAVIDTGMDFTHPSLSAAAWINPGEIADNNIDDDGNGFIDDVHGWNFVDDNNNPQDCNNHGTHVSGIIRGTSQNIMPDGLGHLAADINTTKMHIMPVKFLDCDGSGTTSDAISAIYYAVNNGAKVLNNSWGGGSYSSSLADAIYYAYQHGVLFVAAAGNSGMNIDSSPSYPASYPIPNVVAVAATDSFDSLAYFSNYGTGSVPIAAPGVSINSTIPGNRYATMSGTSMAAPFVTGMAALILYEQPAMTGYQVKGIITAAGDQIAGLSAKVTNGARINAMTTVLNAASASVSASQPSYNINDLNSSRDPASATGSGCGLVQQVYDKYDNDQKDSRRAPEPLSIAITFLILMVPVLTALSLRRDPKKQRRYNRYILGSQVQIHIGEKDYLGSVSTISLGGLSFQSQAILKLGHTLQMAVAGPDGVEQIVVDGQIVWATNNNAYGVKFMNTAENTLVKINQWSSKLKRT